MTNPKQFNPLQAQELADAFQREGVDYLFIGKSGMILLGYPSTTQDLDIFTPKDPKNAPKIIRALERLGFVMDAPLRSAITEGRDFIQIKNGPFDLDIVHAPDGIENYAFAKARRIVHEKYPIASLDDIIASKRASNRLKDRNEIPLLEAFKQEYERSHPQSLPTAAEASLGRRSKRKP